jgi:hypothetical protein
MLRGAFVDRFADALGGEGVPAAAARSSGLQEALRRLLGELEHVKQAAGKRAADDAARREREARALPLAQRVHAALGAVLAELVGAAERPGEGLTPELKSLTFSWHALWQELEHCVRFKLPVVQLLFEKRIVYLDEATGQVIHRMRFPGLAQELLEYRWCDGQVHSSPTLSIRTCSFNAFLQTASQVAGVSGTVGHRNPGVLAFLREAWGYSAAYAVPEFCRSRRAADAHRPELHTRGDRAAWSAAVLVATRARMAAQPVLVVAKSPEEALELRTALRAGGVSAALYQSAHDEHLLGRRFVPGDVVIATNLGGRGSDYKVDLGRAPAGLHAIVAFDSDEPRIIEQAIGRCGRAGQPGSYQRIAHETLRQRQDPRESVRKLHEVVRNDAWFGVYQVLSLVVSEEAARLTDEHRQRDQTGGSGAAAVRLLQQRFTWWLSSRSARDELRPALRRVLGTGGFVSSLFGRSARTARSDFYEALLAAFEQRVGAPHVLSDRLRQLVRSKLELKVGPHLDRLQHLKVEA